MKLTFILLLSFCLLSGCANSQSPKQKNVIESVNAKKFKELVDANQGITLDVRTPKEVAEGHIANATVIDIYEDDFVQRINKLDKNKEVYVYCRAGGRSMDAARILEKNGFRKVYNLEKGITEWEEAGFPLKKN